MSNLALATDFNSQQNNKLFHRALKLNILSKNTNDKRYKDDQRSNTVMAPFSGKVAVSVINHAGTCK